MPRNVLITGGSSGIGAACARAFAAQGDVVWFTYRSGRARAEALLAELPASAAAFAFDQGDPRAATALIEALPGPVDVLVNNAGLGSATVEGYVAGKNLQDLALLQVNALGPLWLVDAVLPGMLARGYGKIVQISSVGGGITTFPNFRKADGMSKAALTFLTRQLAAELAERPVETFAICPGATETAMFEASTLSHLDEAARAAFVAGLPKGRLIDPAEIAAVTVFLCSPAGTVLHGAVIDASNGLGSHPGLITGKNA